LFRRRTTEPSTTTTSLIGRWSMEGARDDVADGFRPTVDLGVLASGDVPEPPEERAPDRSAPLLLKPAGGGDWQPLLT